MGKKVIIAEKPSVARGFAKVLNVNGVNKNGYIEGEDTIVTWCVGHLVTMSYPEVYDSKLKYWRLSTLPFIPKEFKYEVIDNVKQQFDIVSQILNREDVSEKKIRKSNNGTEYIVSFKIIEILKEEFFD